MSTAQAEVSKPTILMLALKDLAPSGTHIQAMRRERFDDKLIGELAESIKAVGILQPILARPMTGEGGAALRRLGKNTHEIVAGERRFLAAKKAGLAEIPVSVRELTDDQVLEVQLIENLQREDLHELEEAEGYEELMKLKKISADTVADMVGRSRSYVFKRTKLLALCPEARKAFYAGELDASKALLIARIPGAELQKEALKGIKEGGQYGEMSTFKDVQDYIHENFMLQLKQAPFKLDDVNLVPAAGACTTCPKRTGNQKELFGDVKSGDTCTDTKCFALKKVAGEAALLAEYKAKGIDVLVGDAAKKVLPWSDEHAGHGYHLTTEKNWSDSKNRKYGEMVEAEDIKVVISPHSGKLLKVVHQSALPGSKSKKKAVIAKKAGPDEAAITERVIRAIHDKFDGQLTKPLLQQLVHEVLIGAENTLYGADGDLADKLAVDLWAMKSMPSAGAHDVLPKAIADLDPKKLARLAVELVALVDLCEGSGKRADVICAALKIDRKKIEKDVAAEAKLAAADNGKKVTKK